MNDYGALAEKLKASGQPAKAAVASPVKREIDPVAFYESVKDHVIVEIGKANVELHKRGLTTIERVFVPCYAGKFSVTFGTVLLCSIGFDEAKARITLVIVGPPHRKEIARKDYALHPGLLERKTAHANLHGSTAHAQSPGSVAADIVSEIIQTGIRLSREQAEAAKRSEEIKTPVYNDALLAEIWLSLASLLRGYTALHGLEKKRVASVEQNETRITVRYAAKLLTLDRCGAHVIWARENGRGGTLQFTDHGSLSNGSGEEAMDMAAERWARQLMLEE